MTSGNEVTPRLLVGKGTGLNSPVCLSSCQQKRVTSVQMMPRACSVGCVRCHGLFPGTLHLTCLFFCLFVTVTCKDDELRKSRLFSSVALFKVTRESYGPKSIFCYSTEIPEFQPAVGRKKSPFWSSHLVLVKHSIFYYFF